MKNYVIPTMEIVVLMAEEQMAKCYKINKSASNEIKKSDKCRSANNKLVGNKAH